MTMFIICNGTAESHVENGARQGNDYVCRRYTHILGLFGAVVAGVSVKAAPTPSLPFFGADRLALYFLVSSGRLCSCDFVDGDPLRLRTS